MPTSLVTGGAGFIGSHLVRQLLAEPDHHVVNLDLLTYAGNLDSLADVLHHPRHSFVHGDIGDTSLVTELLRTHAPDRIFHLAAESHVDRSIDAPRTFVGPNVAGTVALLDATQHWWQAQGHAAQRAFRFVHVSTDEVYGSLGPTGRFTEASPYAPNSPYAASKAAADHFVRAFHHTFGLPTLVSHASNNYGPNQFPEKLIPLLILNAIEGRPLPIYGDGAQVRDWIHVTDHCAALRAIARAGRPGETYNVGGGEETTNLQIATTVCDAVDDALPGLPHGPCRTLLRHVEDRPGHDRRYAIDSSKLEGEVGFRPHIPLRAGLRDTVHWYLKHPAWVQRVQSGGYHRERLGLGSPAHG